MKVLFIGGTGNISTSVSRLVLAAGIDLWLLNRSGAGIGVEGRAAKVIQASIHNEAEVESALNNHRWDVVVNWVAFDEADIERDIRLFQGRTAQYVFISSASCYQNPNPLLPITEETPLGNPYWDYSRNKIRAEERLMRAHVEADFPVTIVRPSHTYATVIPITIGGWDQYTTINRIKQGLPIVVQDDGTSLWTLTHADDFANGFIGLLGKKQALGEAYHITSDEVLSWNKIYQLTAQSLGCEAKIIHVDSKVICEHDQEYIGTLLGDKAVNTVFDNSKIKAINPSFKAKVAYEDGIKKTLAWFEGNKDHQIIDDNTNALIEKLIRL
ncbi:MAG: NAD-dependent dehydratase [Alteromonadaceae bacterium]|nr:MAG: NAD-dependent dehydratase [Alteromonadaceae bacterium]